MHTPERGAAKPSKPRLKAFTIPDYHPDKRKVRGALRRLERLGVDHRTAFDSEWRGVNFVASPDMTPLEDGYVLYYDLADR